MNVTTVMGIDDIAEALRQHLNTPGAEVRFEATVGPGGLKDLKAVILGTLRPQPQETTGTWTSKGKADG